MGIIMIIRIIAFQIILLILDFIKFIPHINKRNNVAVAIPKTMSEEKEYELDL